MQRPIVMRVCGVVVSGLIAWMTAIPAEATYITTVGADTPIGYWRLDDASGATASNSVTGGVSGTYCNNTKVTYGKAGALTLSGDIDSAVGFSGTGKVSTGGDSNAGYLTIPSSVFNGIGTGVFSVELWFNANSVASRRDIVTYKESAGSEFGLFINGTKQLETISAHTQPTTFFASHVGSTVAANSWYQVVLTRDLSSSLTTYVNGANTGAVQFSDSLATNGTVYVGTNYNSTQKNCFGFGGSVDEVSIYGTCLSEDRVLAHYNAGITMVPEPTAAILLGSALVGLLAYASRKRK